MITFRVVDVDKLTHDDEARLVDLVARTFPNEAAPGGPLHGKWTYDSRPSFVVLAISTAPRKADELVGVRVVVERNITVPFAARIAGIGIAVAPEWQGMGVGRGLTREVLVELEERAYDMALAFLFTPNAERLLRSLAFTKLSARVSYVDRASGARVVEQSPAWALDVVMKGAVDRIEKAGELDLGVGTW